MISQMHERNIIQKFKSFLMLAKKNLYSIHEIHLYTISKLKVFILSSFLHAKVPFSILILKYHQSVKKL